MPRFEFLPTPLAGLSIVERRLMEDRRGFLSRCYCVEEFAAAGVQKPVAQINHTLTKRRGTVRGLHFQWPPHGEIKLVSCLRGEVFDVAVDLRRNSPTFLQWHGEMLSAAIPRSLLIPEGFAHGFQALSDDCEIVYVVTAAYQPSAEGAVSATDPRVDIRWPLPITELSTRDRSHPDMSPDFAGIEVP